MTAAGNSSVRPPWAKPPSSGRIPAFLVPGAGLLAWAVFTQLLLRLLLHLLPLASSGQPAASLLSALLLPQVLYLAQGLFFVPFRPEAAPVFLRPLLSSSPLIFLPLPFSPLLEKGVVFEAAAGREGDLLMEAAAARLQLTLAGRLAWLLEGRSPLELLLTRLMNSRKPLSWLGLALALLIGPVRLLTRLLGYLSLLVWRRWEEVPPVEWKRAEPLRRSRARAFELRALAARLEGKTDWRVLGEALDRLRGKDGSGAPFRQPPEFERPWLQPGYRGLYLELPATSGANSPANLYDGGPEEEPGIFYPPELGLEVEELALIRADREFLHDLNCGPGLFWLDGRLLTSRELESEIADLGLEISRREKRLAAHHRRCRSSALAAARRRGGDWPEIMIALGKSLFYAERLRPDLMDKILSGLLAAEERVCSGLEAESGWTYFSPEELEHYESLLRAANGKNDDSAESDFLAFPAPQAETLPNSQTCRPSAIICSAAAGVIHSRPRPDCDSKGKPSFIPPRAYLKAESFGLGFGRVALALFLLALLIWQGFSLNGG